MINLKSNKLTEWYKLAQPNKKLMILHVFWGILRIIGLIISPFFAAKVTIALTSGNYKTAILNLAIELFLIFFAYISYDQIYRNAGRLFKNSYNIVQHKIYQKAYRAKTSNFKITSREKLLNIIGTDIDVVSTFADIFCVKISRALQVIITLTIVFILNWIVGICILILSIINLFILIKLNQNITKQKERMYENKDKIYEQFSQVLSNQKLIKQYDIGQTVANNYFERCNKYSKSYSKYLSAASKKENFFLLFYKTLIFSITCFMIKLVYDNIISLEVYFVVVPYILTSVELINEIINISANIEEISISTKRINTILNFTDKEFIEFGKIQVSNNDSKLILLNVSLNSNKHDSSSSVSIDDITMNFSSSQINTIKGKSGCGKKLIFELLTRQITPDKGILLFNDINLLEYSKSAYKSIISTAYSSPIFLNDSIINNFSITNASLEDIERNCKSLGIYDFINDLPNKFDTNITDISISKQKLFLLGLAIASLMDSKIICIYEIPDATTKEKNEIKDAILELSKHKTIILFTHSSLYDDISSTIYEIEDGKIISSTKK